MALEMQGKDLRDVQEKGPSGLRLDVWSEGEGGAGKSLIPGLDNLVNDYVIHDDRKLRGETKPRGGRSWERMRNCDKHCSF